MNELIAETATASLWHASAHRLPLAEKSVHCVVTSPPYFGLRRYHGEQDTIWPGGSYLPITGAGAMVEIPGPTTQEALDACAHDFSREFHPPGHRTNDSNPGALQHDGNKNRDKLGGYQCAKCGALRCGFGSEESAEAYIWHSLLVLRELRRVLRDDGVIWWNIGDSYAGGGRGAVAGIQHTNFGSTELEPMCEIGIEGGNLIGVPHRLMLAAQADGWTVRNDCVWAKTACMPESLSGLRWERHRVRVGKSKRATSPAMAGKSPAGAHSVITQVAKSKRAETQREQDKQWMNCPGCDVCASNGGYVLRKGSWRHTRSHEFILMLTKGMNYWADGEAVKEPAADSSIGRQRRGIGENHKNIDGAPGQPPHSMAQPRGNDPARPVSATRNPRNVINVEPTDSGEFIRLIQWLEAAHPEILDEIETDEQTPTTILRPSPSSYSGLHYATFPPELIRKLIQSATPTNACPTCGKGWSPIVDKLDHGFADRTFRSPHNVDTPGMTNATGATTLAKVIENRVVGYAPTCGCAEASEPVRGVCLDPFCGSGTTGVVCREIGVRFIGCDISREYLEGQAMDRALRVTPAKKIVELPLFAKQEVMGKSASRHSD